MISFNCVQCGKRFLTPEHLAGRQGKCPRCGTVYTIPQPDAPLGEPTPSAATGEFVAAPEPKEEPPEPETPKIRFTCEECGRKFAVSVGLAGNAGTCPDCGTMFLVPPYSEGEAPPPPPSPPPYRPPVSVPSPQVSARPTPVRTAKPTASGPVVLASAPSEPQTSSKPTTMLPAPQYLSTKEPQRTSKPTATVPAVTAPPPSSQVEVRADKPFLTSSAQPSGGGGAKGLVAALFLCALAAGGAFWAWKSVAQSPGGTGTSAAGPNDPSMPPTPAPPPPKPTPPPVTYTQPPPEDPVLIPPTEDPTPPSYEDPHPVDPSPPTPADPASPTPIDPSSLAPPIPDAAQVAAAIAEFERQRGYVKDSPDAVQQARALDALSCVIADARVIEALGKVLLSPAELPLVRKKAAEMLGDSRSTEAVASLAGGFEACRAQPEVARAAVVSLGRIDCAASVKALSTVMRSWMQPADEARDHMYASVAVISLSQMSSRRNESVDALLGFWAGLVAARPADTSRLSDDEWKHESHRAELEAAVQGSLSVLSGQAFAAYEEWKAWWAEKRGTLK